MKLIATRRLITVILVALALLCPPLAHAQTRDQPAAVAQPAGEIEMYELVLKDGSRLYGRIERETPQDVVFRTHSGASITTSRQEIVSLKVVKPRNSQAQVIRDRRHRPKYAGRRPMRAPTRGRLRCDGMP